MGRQVELHHIRKTEREARHAAQVPHSVAVALQKAAAHLFDVAVHLEAHGIATRHGLQEIKSRLKLLLPHEALALPHEIVEGGVILAWCELSGRVLLHFGLYRSLWGTRRRH